VRTFKLNDAYKTILFLIGKAYTQRRIAQELSLSEQLTSYKVSKLIKEGYAIQEQRTSTRQLLLTTKGIEAIASFTYAKSLVFNQPSQPKHSKQACPGQTTRDHAFEAKFELLNPLSLNEPTRILQANKLYSKQLGLKHQEGAAYFEGRYNGLLTYKSLILYSQEVEVPQSADIALLTNDLIKGLFDTAYDLEPRLGIKLKRNAKGLLLGTIIKHEIALKNHPMAKQAKDNNSKIYAYHPETGDLFFITDFSHGFPEFEAVSKKTANFDIEEATKATVWMGSGSMREWVAFSEQRADRMERLMLNYGEALNKHLPVLQLAEELLKKSPSHRARQAVLDLKQAKLMP
jgi:predicted transcriptional regulator